MRPAPALLLNTECIELLPARLLRARSNLDARLLAQATWLLRRKCDGRYLAAASARGLHALLPRLLHEPGIDAALDRLDALPARRPPDDAALWYQQTYGEPVDLGDFLEDRCQQLVEDDLAVEAGHEVVDRRRG
jgi:D-alanyl-D-alanine carboxypeptidase